MPEQSLIADLFPACVATACRRVGDDCPGLYPQERQYMQKAVEKRRREFAAGRTCARDALAALDFPPGPILRTDLSAPLWPQNCVGTISHSHSWAGAAVARTGECSGIGIDIETVERVSMNIARKVFTPAEAAAMDKLPASRHGEFLAFVFSAKEAVYKCLAPLVSRPMGFEDAEVRQEDSSCFTVSMAPAIAAGRPACTTMTGRYFMHEGCVFTGIFIAA